MQTFNIDISQPRGPLVLYASQGDSLSRFFAVTVTDSGAAYEPPAGAVYTVRFGAPGMPAGWYDTSTEVGGGTHPAVVVSGNTLTVELAEQAVSVPGTNALVLIISDATGYTLASWAFVLQVARVPGYDAPEATVYYNALTEQVAQVLASAQAAAASASESAANATLAESWAVGGTGTRPGEDTDNAEYWAQQAQQVSQGALGWYATPQALQSAHPTGENGQWAIIGSTDTIWTWDSDTSAWVNSGAQVDLSNYYTKAQADAAFATAAQGTLAASAVQTVNGLPGPNPTLTAANVGAAPASDGISTYTCVTSGTIHALTGTGNNIKFVADAAYATGDTITVNGTTVTAQTQDGEPLSGGAWAAGAVVACYLNGTTLNFKVGGGKGVDCGSISAYFPSSAGQNYTPEIEYAQYDYASDMYGLAMASLSGLSVQFTVSKSGQYCVGVIAVPRTVSYAAGRIVDSNGQSIASTDGGYTVPAYQDNFCVVKSQVVSLSSGTVYHLEGYGDSIVTAFLTLIG